MLKSIINSIKPTKKEEAKIKDQIDEVLKKIRIKDTKLILGGSFAKDTWLKGAHDIDIFVKFNYQKYKNKSNELSQILHKQIKKLKPIKLHGSRDYFQVKNKNLTFELIPILDIKNASQAKNITDISPLHSKWVKRTNNIQDQIRLTKAFSKAQNIYGAESHLQGLSGYALEVLTIHYKSFNNLIKKASKWKPKTIIDPEKLLKNPIIELNKSKTHSPLILVDPVDKTRNVTAALSKEKYNLLIKSCKSYLKNPSKKFFIKKLEKIPKGAIILEVTPKKGKPDAIGGKLYSLFNKIKKQIILEGFKIKKSGFIFNQETTFWFLLTSNKLPKTKLFRGPPIKNKKHLIRFKKKHKKIIIKKGIAYTKVKIQHPEIINFLKNLIKDNNIKNATKKINIENKR